MVFLQGDDTYRPRSKKEKQRQQEQRRRELAAKRSREEQLKAAPEFKPKYSIPPRNTHINISSGASVKPKIKESVNPEYDEEMLAREQAAQAEAERRKKCVAPAYNKGAYQPVFTPEQAKWVGRS